MGAPGAHRGLRRTRVTQKKAPGAWYNHLGVRPGVLGARLAGLSLVKFRLRAVPVPAYICKGAPVDSPGVLEAALTTQGLASTQEPSQTEETTECSKSGRYSPPR